MASRRRRTSSLQENPTQIPIIFRRPRSASVVETAEHTDILPAGKLSGMILRQVRSELWMQSVDVRSFTAQHLQASLPKVGRQIQKTTSPYIQFFHERATLGSRLWLAEYIGMQTISDKRTRIKHATTCYYRSWPITREQLDNPL